MQDDVVSEATEGLAVPSGVPEIAGWDMVARPGVIDSHVARRVGQPVPALFLQEDCEHASVVVELEFAAQNCQFVSRGWLIWSYIGVGDVAIEDIAPDYV